MLQADILGKARSLKTLEQNVSHTETFEMATRDQNKMSCISGIVALQMTTYHQQKQTQNTEQTMNNNSTCPIITWNYHKMVGM